MQNFVVRGFKGTDGTIDVVIPSKSAGLKVLCDRHNSDLSVLDNHAGEVFRQLGEAIFPIRHPQAEPLTKWVYIDGPKIEAFMVKVIAAHQASNTFTHHGVPVKYRVDDSKMRRAILKGEFEDGGGMYVCAARTSNEIDGVQYHAISADGWLVGIHAVIRGFSFITLFDKERSDLDTIPEISTYRPSVHQLYAQGGSAYIFIAWRRRASLSQYSRGGLLWAEFGSSSTAPFRSLEGAPELDIRTKLVPEQVGGVSRFAPKPNGQVVPQTPPTKRR